MTGALLTLAFTSGLLAPVNPYGFALLPTYLTHAASAPDSVLASRLVRAMGTGAALAAGFALTLSAAGLAISAGAHELVRRAPQIGFGIGVLLALLGLVGLVGAGPRLAIRRPNLTITRTARGPLRWALFGIGYAAASLACTFGVLLAVIAQAQASTGWTGQAVVFAAYAAGSITLLLLLSAAAALAGAALHRAVRTLGRWQARITAALLLVTGGYVAVYWWPAVTGSAPVGRGLPALDHWSSCYDHGRW
jgi:cytochrome c-type biogenesis protein